MAWLVSGYAHVLVLLSIVIVTLSVGVTVSDARIAVLCLVAVKACDFCV